MPIPDTVARGLGLHNGLSPLHFAVATVAGVVISYSAIRPVLPPTPRPPPAASAKGGPA